MSRRTKVGTPARGTPGGSRGGLGRALRRARRDERGIMLILFAALIAMLLAFAALAVDIGMIFTAQTQLQRAADSGALAGAGWLATSPGDFDGARTEAEFFTERHEAIRDSIDIDPALDIEFPGDTLIRVWARRTEARANPLSTFFARILGLDDVDVTVRAAAVVAPAALIDQCLFPFIPPDAWREPDGTRSSEVPFTTFDEAPTFDAAAGDVYEPPETLCGGGSGDCWPAFTGWGAKSDDQGRYFIARWGQTGNNVPSAGWWYTLNMPPDGTQGGGAIDVADAIRGDCSAEYIVGQGSEVYIQTGVAKGPINSALEDALAGEPSDAATAILCYQGQSESCGESGYGRMRTLMFYEPADPPGPGSSVAATVGNFGRIWLAGFCTSYTALDLCAGLSTKDQESTFVVMYLGPAVTGLAADGGEGSSGLVAVRLVE